MKQNEKMTVSNQIMMETNKIKQSKEIRNQIIKSNNEIKN